MIRTPAIVLLSLSVSSLSAFATDAESAHPEGSTIPIERTTVVANVDRSPLVAALANPVDASLSQVVTGHPRTRPGMLPALYVSFSALQAFDVYSTRRALAQGARESNPVMQGVVGNPVVFIALKAATTAVPMLIAERMWRTNRVGAIALMVIANGAMAAVAANNAHVLQQR